MNIFRELAHIINTGYLKNLNYVYIKYTNRKMIALLELLTHEGYVLGWHREHSQIKLYLRYTHSGIPSRTHIKVFCKSAKPRYYSAKAVWMLGGGLGVYIYQTTNGIITNSEICKQHIGGLLLIWIN